VRAVVVTVAAMRESPARGVGQERERRRNRMDGDEGEDRWR
jgi:hypothetical protein